MELSDASRRLIGWESRFTMQEHRCSCCDQEAGPHGHDPSTPVLRQIAHRIRRMTQILVFGLFLVILVMALLIAVLLGGRIQVPDNQAMPVGNALLVSEKQQQQEHPSAFLTAPRHSTNNKYLEWETTSGIAHCRGFRYSGGNLTVLRDGYYSIALQITLMNSKETCDENPIQSNIEDQLHVTVFHCTEQYPTFEVLLVTYDTMCCSEGCKKSLFTSGVFFLKASTVLRVEALHPEHIRQRQNEHEVFFGVHLQS